jgi:hypothetical protein
MLVQIEKNFATVTPFGSLIRISPVKVSRGKSLTAKLRACLLCFFVDSQTNSAFASALGDIRRTPPQGGRLGCLLITGECKALHQG